MAAAQSLLLHQQIHRTKPYSSPPPQFPPNTFSSVNFKTNIPSKSFKKILTVKHSLLNNSTNNANGDGDSIRHHRELEKIILLPKSGTKRNRVEIAVETLIVNALESLQKPIVVAAVAILGLLVLNCNPNSFAWAASGGRMGGGSSSSSSSSASRSKSTSSRRGSLSWRNNCSSSSNHCSSSDQEYSSGVDYGMFYLIFIPSLFALILAVAALNTYLEFLEKRTSVIKLQIGLSGTDKSLRKDLNRIAQTTDTSTSKGFHSVLTDTMLALLRYPDNYISAYLSVISTTVDSFLSLIHFYISDMKKKKEDIYSFAIVLNDLKKDAVEGEKIFYQLSFEERCKLDEETLVNVNNIKKQSSTAVRSSGLISDEHVVVTILVVARQPQKLPSIENNENLKEALKKLGCLPLDSIVAVEVLWTPQKKDDTLSEQELIKNYPLLHPLHKV
ncbi:PREDICTED: uncharacterized protein LOC105958434 [Erythranthe guttata]|uniref:uncharacterized protein LOC105958434 n=1 Tax=Erythranthe guttata TaxID=4155 RepID=UPI00064D76B4|nr:PREDICTED: uncharacterized protein LOC105958434 [Erythranthe guttata]|eukprot:XP_012837893.1 PREDICTED: uncharacterized protein LOC105958434 [Erythranthe guttata]